MNLKGRLFTVTRSLVMGILNITPDSFYSGSRINDENSLLQKAEHMLHQGADILDLGGQSTRPGSALISAEDELRRILPAIESVSKKFPEAILSVDTYYSSVAREAVSSGASIVNDISAGTIDPDIIPTVASLGVPYICMHMPGTPQNMQSLNFYADLTTDVISFLANKINSCREAGIKDIIADPGFGFGKNIEQNFEMLQQLEKFQVLRVPILVGLSRKSTVYKTLAVTAEEALNGTTVLHTIALLKKASILRVHDVREAVQAVKLISHVQPYM